MSSEVDPSQEHIDESSYITGTDLPRWGDLYEPPEDDKSSASSTAKSSKVKPRFPFASKLNSRIALFNGDITKLAVDAIVVPTNERMNSETGPYAIFRKKGGAMFNEAVAAVGGHCRMSEVKMTPAFGVAAKSLIHTVGPRYNAKYITAAVNALNKCYLNSLQAAVDAGYRSVAFCPIHTDEKSYPVSNGTAIAVRTLRRFLEHYPDNLDVIVLCLSNPVYERAYLSILPQYLPRSDEEAIRMEKKLPADVGDEWGESSVAEREIRISALPGMGADEYDDICDDIEEDLEVCNTPKRGEAVPDASSGIFELAKKQPSPDARAEADSSNPMSINYVSAAFQSVLTHAKNLTAGSVRSLEKLGFFYRCGEKGSYAFNRMGRELFVFDAQAAANPQLSREAILPYVVRLLDSASYRKYTIVYFHSALCGTEALDWLQDLAAICPRRYLLNMRMCILYAGFWFKNSVRMSRFGAYWEIEDVSFYDSIAELFSDVNMISDVIQVPIRVIKDDITAREVAEYKPDSGH